MDPQLREKARRAVDAGLHYLRSQQGEDGSVARSVGITALSLRAFLESHRGYNEGDGPFITKQVDFLLSKVNDDGSISESLQNRSYNTAVALNALTATKNPKYEPVVAGARKFLTGHQIDEGEGYKPEHRYYGGVGYGGDERPDMSNLYLALEGLKSASTDPKDPVWEKALVFVNRSQNRSESNDQSWAANDGGFVYMPGWNPPEFANGTNSYGGMTAAGLISLLFAGVDKSDPRVQAAYQWITANYSLEVNPGHQRKTRAVLLLQRVRQGDGGLWRGRVHRRQGPEAQLAQRARAEAGQPAGRGRLLGQSGLEQVVGGQAAARHGVERDCAGAGTEVRYDAILRTRLAEIAQPLLDGLPVAGTPTSKCMNAR